MLISDKLKPDHFYEILPGSNLFQAYDQHLNMILGDVEETVTTVEIDEETYEEVLKGYTIRKKKT